MLQKIQERLAGQTTAEVNTRSDRPRRRPPRLLRSALAATGILRLRYRLRERFRGFIWRYQDSTSAPDGLPVPPSDLRVLVAGMGDLPSFLHGGVLTADLFRSALGEQGHDLADVSPILDFGCGCGRVARNLVGPGVALYGCDYNPRLAGWAQDNLPMQVATSSADPPLPYENDQFGFVYAVSVFTHFDQDRQGPWLSELARVTRPGGFIALTLQGRHFAEQALTDAELERFDAGDLVVIGDGLSGMNACAAFHPVQWLTGNLPTGLSVVAHQPGAAAGTGHQDLVVLAAA